MRGLRRGLGRARGTPTRAFELETVCLVLADDVEQVEDRGIIRRLPHSEFNSDDVQQLVMSPDGRVGRFSDGLNERLFGEERQVARPRRLR